MADPCLARPLPQIKNIIVPTDMTRSSEAAVYARSIAERFGAMLQVVHVIGSEPLAGSMGEPYIEEDKVDRLALNHLSGHQPAPVSSVPHEVTVSPRHRMEGGARVAWTARRPDGEAVTDQMR